MMGYPASAAAGLAAVLERCGFLEVARIHGEQEVLAALFTETFDLILLGGSDWAPARDLVRALRRLPACGSRRAHIIVTLPDAKPEHLARLRDAGVNQVAREPLSADELARRLALVDHDHRRFIESLDFAGPDRRMGHAASPSPTSRRATDFTVHRQRTI